MDGVEIDSELSDIGRRYFDMNNPRLHLYHEDARPFIRRIDAELRRDHDRRLPPALHPLLPDHRRVLRDASATACATDGVLVINAGHPEGQDAFEKVLSATIGEAFPYVMRDPIQPTNTLIVASSSPLSADADARRPCTGLPAGLRATAVAAAARIEPPLARRRRLHRRQGAGGVADRQVDRGLRGGRGRLIR